MDRRSNGRIGQMGGQKVRWKSKVIWRDRRSVGWTGSRVWIDQHKSGGMVRQMDSWVSWLPTNIYTRHDMFWHLRERQIIQLSPDFVLHLECFDTSYKSYWKSWSVLSEKYKVVYLLNKLKQYLTTLNIWYIYPLFLRSVYVTSWHSVFYENGHKILIFSISFTKLLWRSSLSVELIYSQNSHKIQRISNGKLFCSS